MFRARKPSVKRPKLESTSPRKRAKLTPAKDIPNVDATSSLDDKIEVKPTTDCEKSVLCPSVRSVTPPPSDKAVKLDKVVDDEKKGLDVATKIGEISPCTVERSDEDIEQDDQVVVVEAKPVVKLATTVKPVTEEKEEEEEDVEEGGEALKLTNDSLKESLVCDEEETEVNRQERRDSEATVDDEETRRLWPPYDNTKDEEFVPVRKERIIEPENDSLIDDALSLLP